jgi:ABC-type branched-subunit amino acid transport system substrate-binding protein
VRKYVAGVSALGLTISAATVWIGTGSVGAVETATSSSKAPIVVGGDGDMSVGQGEAIGFRAGIYRFNKSGGLDGRKIKFVGYLDDGFSPATNLTNAQELVRNDGAFAVAPFVGATGGAATGQFLESSKVPFIGWASNAAFYLQPKWGFGISGNSSNPEVQSAMGMLQIIAAEGATNHPSKVKMALVGNDVAGAITSTDAFATVAKKEGIDVVSVQSPIAVQGTTSYAPYALTLIASGANTIYENLGSADVVGLSAALKAAGFKGTIVNEVAYYPGQLASQASVAAALNGTYVIDAFPASQNDTAATKQAVADFKAIGQAPDLTPAASAGYWSAIVLEQMLKATLARVGNISKVNPSALQQTVTASKGWTYNGPIAGGLGEESFPSAEVNSTPCSTLVREVGTTYKQVEPYQCSYDFNIKTGQKINTTTGKPLT